MTHYIAQAIIIVLLIIAAGYLLACLIIPRR